MRYVHCTYMYMYMYVRHMHINQTCLTSCCVKHAKNQRNVISRLSRQLKLTTKVRSNVQSLTKNKQQAVTTFAWPRPPHPTPLTTKQALLSSSVHASVEQTAQTAAAAYDATTRQTQRHANAISAYQQCEPETAQTSKLVQQQPVYKDTHTHVQTQPHTTQSCTRTLPPTRCTNYPWVWSCSCFGPVELCDERQKKCKGN